MNPGGDLRSALLTLIDNEPADAAERRGVQSWLGRMCRVATRTLPADGVGVSLMAAPDIRGFTAASSPVSELVEELQFTLGEGPCQDAFLGRVPVLAHDLSLDQERWPAYASAARSHGVEAVFAFPMQIGRARVGVLDVYQGAPGALSGTAMTKALMFAEVALATVLAQEGDDPQELDDFDLHRLEVYQAQGMVAIQLGADLDEALVRLRAYAFANNRRILDVARDVVNRRLAFDQDDV